MVQKIGTHTDTLFIFIYIFLYALAAIDLHTYMGLQLLDSYCIYEMH